MHKNASLGRKVGAILVSRLQAGQRVVEVTQAMGVSMTRSESGRTGIWRASRWKTAAAGR